MNKKYPVTKLSFEGGRQFYQFFVFLPDGPEIFTGSYSIIIEALKSFPTSHAVVIRYMKGTGSSFREYKGKKILSRIWTIVGKNCSQYTLQYFRNDKKRRLFRLSKTNGEVLGEWRQLPKKHLKQFKSVSKYRFINS